MRDDVAQRNDLLTVQEAAEYLAISPSLVYRLVADRQIQHIRIGIGRGTIRFQEDDLEKYKHSRES